MDGSFADALQEPDQDKVTRANLRLPTWTTKQPAATFNPLSVTGAPSIRTPPCSTIRKASEEDGHRLASLSNCPIPSGAPARATSGTSSGMPPRARL